MYRVTKSALSNNLGLLLVAIAAFAVLWNVLHAQPAVGRMSVGVLAWWTTLCAISVVNLCAWRHSAAALAQRRATAEPSAYRFQQRQLLLSAVYVLGCGFRSVLPRADVQRLSLFDSWASSVLVGRSVATLAELCFMIQWAILLNTISRNAGVRSGVFVSWLLVPLIMVAETCSWYAVLTTSYLGNAIEESIWALSATLLIVSGLALWTGCRRSVRPFLGVAILIGIAYVTFMCTVDIPMYVTRWQADEAMGRTYLSLGEGLRDVWARRDVSFEWEQWRTEVPWMILYFSVCVWCSIALVHAPQFVSSRRLSA